MLVQTSLVHTAQVRAHKIAWDGREVVQHGLNSITSRSTSTPSGGSATASRRSWRARASPVRILVEGGGFNLPSSLMERTGAIRMCLIGYVGESARIVTAKEAKPLVVVESGDMGGTDPAPEQPDLWAKPAGGGAHRHARGVPRKRSSQWTPPPSRARPPRP